MRPSTVISVLLALTSFSFAAPASSSHKNELEDRTVSECQEVNVIITILETYKAAATSFCSSYLSIPVSTVTTVTTTTVTLSKRDFSSPELEERGNEIEGRNQDTVPTYLSAFVASQISEACSCLSISPSKTTVTSTYTKTSTPSTTPPSTKPISTKTKSVSPTTSSATQCPSTLPTFILQLDSSNVILNGENLVGTYANLDTGDGDLVGFNGLTDPSSAVVLSLNAAGNLVIQSNGFIAYTDPGQAQELLHFNDPADVLAAGEIPAVCSVAGGHLTCATGADTILQLCPGDAVTNDLFIGAPGASDYAGCVAVVLGVVCV